MEFMAAISFSFDLSEKVATTKDLWCGESGACQNVFISLRKMMVRITHRPPLCPPLPPPTTSPPSFFFLNKNHL